jgi:[NiFe] hydrogenase assembly HybE family chaperone
MDKAPQREEIADFAARLEAYFRDIHRRVMADAPISSAALDVACVGFRAWDYKCLGVLVTPWFMNLVLAPVSSFAATQSVVFPCGAIEFRLSDLPGFGPMAMCSLFSPMQEFADQHGAIATAQAALDALFDPRLLDSTPAREATPAAPNARRETPAERAEKFRLAEAEREIQDSAPKEKLQLNRRFFLLRGRAQDGKAPAP